MPNYEFSCAECGAFQLTLPMSAPTSAADCPECGSTARRRYTAPALRASAPALSRLADRAAESAERPQVTTALPAARRPGGARAAHHPLHAKLPQS